MQAYEKYKESSLTKERFKTYLTIQPLINKLSHIPNLRWAVVGKSIEGRKLSLISIGNRFNPMFFYGRQMHGDERHGYSGHIW